MEGVGLGVGGEEAAGLGGGGGGCKWRVLDWAVTEWRELD